MEDHSLLRWKYEIPMIRDVTINRLTWETAFYKLRANENFVLKHKFCTTVYFSQYIPQKDSVLP